MKNIFIFATAIALPLASWITRQKANDAVNNAFNIFT